MADSTDAVDTEIVYFSRDEKFKVEKPYTTAFPVSNIPGAQVDNHQWEFHPVQVRNVRGNLIPDLYAHGFQYVSWETNLSRADFESDETIKTAYYRELATLLKEHFPWYKRVAFFDHAIRSRSPLYPEAKGTATSTPQPFRFAHVDFTANGAKLKLENSLGSKAEERLKMQCDVLNIWRLLNEEPTKDWPLAFCDWQSVDPLDDLIAHDVVYQGGLGENCYLQHNPKHMWWYLRNQEPNEVVIFRNVSLNDASAARAFHCAFRNPLATETDCRRESIEVRLAAFY